MTDFNNLYLRPNLANTGTTPVAGSTCSSPDICIAGTKPISNYQSVLKSADSYASIVDNGIAANMENFIYLRAKNNMDEATSTDAFLYYAEASCIQWPSKWKNNGIPTDISDKDFGNIIQNVPSKGIGVTERPFIWRAPSNPPTNDHYCLIARLTSDVDPNPMPNLNRSLDIAALIRDNLRWSQRNVTMMKNDLPVTSFEYVLDIPPDTADESSIYQTCVTPILLKGCEIELTCSVTDSDGKPISIPRTEITKDDQIGYFSKNRLERGFRGLIIVYIYNPKSLPIPTGSGVDIDAQYLASSSEISIAESRGILDTVYHKHLSSLRLDSTTITHVLKIGGYVGIMK